MRRSTPGLSLRSRGLTRRQRTSALVLAAIALCFITLDLSGGSLRGAHSGVRGTLGALYRGTDSMLGPARRWAQGVPSAGTNRSRIDALTNDNAQLRARLAAVQAQQHVGQRVADLQHAADLTGRRLLPARVTALGPGQGFDWTVALDVGTRSGVQVGQTVTDGAGLVGRVLHADADSSTVLLAADPGSGVGVRDLGTGELGVVTGRGSAGFSFRPLKPDAVIKVGDALATGPAGATTYVPGLAVGRVTAVRTSADGTTTATVAPTASPTTVDVVAVVLTPGNTPANAERAALRPGRPGRTR